jgi:hypothetical protein
VVYLDDASAWKKMERAETEPDKNNGSSKSLGRCDEHE